MGARIAVVDDEAILRTWLQEHLTAAGHEVDVAATGNDALRLVHEWNPELVVLDLRLPDLDGLALLPRLQELDRDIIVVMVTAYGEIETAVQAVKAGAYQFLQKPLDLNDLLITIEKGLEARRLRREVAGFRELHRWQFASVEVVGRSAAMASLVKSIEKVARTDSATVLLQGESGTGKDLVARAIHAQSQRRDRPFLEVNCTALPEHLLESELFGHERGAFTGAHERKKGLVELAEGGTLLLDEIGDMPLSAQAKLLGFLENSAFKRLGGTSDLSVDVRVIAATNRDLEAAVEDRSFRNDLYFRLKVVPLHLPPLRERREDVAPLAMYFIERLARDLKREPPRLTTGAVEVLESHAWPGNVRELRNLLERVLILEESDEIRPEHLSRLGLRARGASGSESAMQLPPNGVRLEDVEHQLIQQALDRTGGNVTQAARLLGLSRETLRYRLRKSHDGVPEA